MTTSHASIELGHVRAVHRGTLDSHRARLAEHLDKLAAELPGIRAKVEQGLPLDVPQQVTIDPVHSLTAAVARYQALAYLVAADLERVSVDAPEFVAEISAVWDDPDEPTQVAS